MGERFNYKVVGGEEDVRGIAKRVVQITVSAIKQMPVLASKMEGCISLGQGIPSFATPPLIREAVIEALRQSDAIGKYSLQPGLPALKEAVARLTERIGKGIRGAPRDALVADIAPPELRGTAYGFFNLLSGLAMLLASALAGLLWDQLEASFTFLAGGDFSALALGAIILRRPD